MKATTGLVSKTAIVINCVFLVIVYLYINYRMWLITKFPNDWISFIIPTVVGLFGTYRCHLLFNSNKPVRLNLFIYSILLASLGMALCYATSFLFHDVTIAEVFSNCLAMFLTLCLLPSSEDLANEIIQRKPNRSRPSIDEISLPE